MTDTATDFNGLPAGGVLQAADVLPLQRGTAADSTKKATGAELAEGVLDNIAAGSGVRRAKSGAALTLSSGGASTVEITGASATLALTHADRFVKFNNSTAQTITIPPQSSVAWPDGAQIEGAQWGAGAVTFVAGSGVTLRKSSKITATTDAQYAPIGLKRVAANEWLLFGQFGSA